MQKVEVEGMLRVMIRVGRRWRWRAGWGYDKSMQKVEMEHAESG